MRLQVRFLGVWKRQNMRIVSAIHRHAFVGSGGAVAAEPAWIETPGLMRMLRTMALGGSSPGSADATAPDASSTSSLSSSAASVASAAAAAATAKTTTLEAARAEAEAAELAAAVAAGERAERLRELTRRLASGEPVAELLQAGPDGRRRQRRAAAGSVKNHGEVDAGAPGEAEGADTTMDAASAEGEFGRERAREPVTRALGSWSRDDNDGPDEWRRQHEARMAQVAAWNADLLAAAAVAEH
jgi:colicin import membrane protein